MAGYSGTPLVKKLGYKAGLKALLVAVPEHLTELTDFMDFGRRVTLHDPAQVEALRAGRFDLIHVFETERTALEEALPHLRAVLEPTGTIWVSWPKKASGVPSTITEDVIRELALPGGLVDVKVCAVDSVWSGLKLMIRRELRETLE